MKRPQKFVLCAISLGTALALAGCSSSSSVPEGVASTGGGQATPTGAPISVGVLTGSLGQGLTGLDKTAQAAANYYNAKGGVHGHVVKVVTCDSTGTPESETTCANKFVAEKVSAVAVLQIINETAFLPPLAAANIPVAINVPLTQAVYASPVTFLQSVAGLETITLGAVYGKAHDLKSNAAIVLNLGGGAAALIGAAKPFYDKAGVAFTSQLVSPGSADLTAPVTAALKDKPAQVSLFLNAPLCVSALKALKTLSYSGQIILGPSCVGETVISQAGDSINGAIAAAPSPAFAFTSDEKKAYGDALSKVGLSADTPNLPAIFSTVSLVTAVWNSLPTTSDYSAAATLAGFRALKDFRYPFDLGIALTCDGKQISFVKSACSPKTNLGKFEGTKQVSAGIQDYSSIFAS